MADDDNDDRRPDEDDGGGNPEPAAVDPPPGGTVTPGVADESAAADPAATPPGPVTGSAAEGSAGDRVRIRTAIASLPPRERNRFVGGTLIVHYSSRDVEFQMDGASGLRLLAVLAGTSNDLDPIDRSSDALRVWMMVDRSDVIAAQWVPERSIVPRRATVDPAGLVDSV